MKIYTLENDYLFKKIFRSELYLKQLLRDMFNVKADKIIYLNTELVKTNKNCKVGIVDMLLNVDNEIVIFELQNINRHNFKERLLFYSSGVIHHHCLKEGEDYQNLKSIKVYAIINYNSFNEKTKDIIKLKRRNKVFTKKLEYQIFDLTKVDKNDRNKKYYELVNLFNCENIKGLERILTRKIYKEILRGIIIYNKNRKEYEKMEDIERLMMNETEHYDMAYEVGKKEGKFDIAKNLLTENVNINIIMNATGLIKEQINSLL